MLTNIGSYKSIHGLFSALLRQNNGNLRKNGVIANVIMCQSTNVGNVLMWLIGYALYLLCSVIFLSEDCIVFGTIRRRVILILQKWVSLIFAGYLVWSREALLVNYHLVWAFHLWPDFLLCVRKEPWSLFLQSVDNVWDNIPLLSKPVKLSQTIGVDAPVEVHDFGVRVFMLKEVK